jgi:hypothetical protein
MAEKTRERLVNVDELLYRQVHPSWVVDGRPTGQAFTPTKKDADQLSTARSSLTSAEDAFRLHTNERQLKSAGTWAIAVAECKEAQLPCFHDPQTSPPEKVADPAHAYVDFSPLPSNGKKDAAGAWLARMARERGCLFAGAA